MSANDEYIRELEAKLSALQAENQRLAAEASGTTETVETISAIAAPAVNVTCPACGDVSDAPNGDADFLLRGVSHCDKCEARIIYGEAEQRVVLEPGEIVNATGSYRVLHIRVQDPASKEDVFRLKLCAESSGTLGAALIASVRRT